ncbi:MAG TPA: hypothetical protein VG796_07765 [Verrucomicrobiales bacterium]|jgi:hypothetical protein|nr:hypothetical protein [Verrucomicrobiales bacterium]
MKKTLLFACAIAFAPMLRAEDSPADSVKAAAKKLADSNYSWTSSSTGGGGGGGGGNRGGGAKTEGMTEKDGPAILKTSFGENTSESVIKAGKVAVKTADGWKSGEELANRDGDGGGGGRGRGFGGAFAARMAENFKAPAAEATTLAETAKDLKKDGDAITGTLSEEAVKARLTFGGRGRAGGGGGNAPAISDAKGTVKFWVKDGVLTKYEVNVTGKREGRDGNTVDINRTNTTEIKDVGKTKLEVPAEAAAKLKGEKAEEKKSEK